MGQEQHYMDFILFNLISMFENVAAFCLMFALFRFKVKEYFIHILFAAFLMSQLSYYMRTVFDFGNIVPFMSMVMMFLMMWLLFQVQIYYAGIMSLVTYIAFSSIQALLVLVQLSAGWLEVIEPFSSAAYVNQLITALISLAASWILLRKRIGFTFVPFSESTPLRLRGENLWYIILIIFLSIFTGMNYYWFFIKIDHIYLVSVMFIVSLCVLLYLSLRKEKLDD